MDPSETAKAAGAVSQIGIGSGAGTALFTILSGTAVLACGQIIQRFLLEPIQEQRKTIGEVAFYLEVLANIDRMEAVRAAEARLQARAFLYMTTEEAARTVRGLAGKLNTSLATIPLYDRLFWLWRVPKRENIKAAIEGLIGWSNSMEGGDNNEFRASIKRALKLPPW